MRSHNTEEAPLHVYQFVNEATCDNWTLLISGANVEEALDLLKESFPLYANGLTPEGDWKQTSDVVMFDWVEATARVISSTYE